MTVLLDREQIQAILPHRDPFLFVDGVTRLEVGRRIEGILRVDDSIRFLCGAGDERFLPPTVLAEAMAQLGAILVLHPEERRGQTIYFRRIERARFRGPVRLDTTVRIRAEVRRMRTRLGTLAVAADIGGEPVATALMSFALG